jgi:uncharacterized membrane protein
MSNPYVGQDVAGPQVDSGRSLATVVYAIQAVAVVTALPLVAGVVLNYLKMDEVRGTWVESHFRWQIRTFWLSLLWGFLLFLAIVVLGLGGLGAAMAGSEIGAAGGVISAVMIGAVGGVAIFAWLLYRIIRGWLRLSENQPI